MVEAAPLDSAIHATAVSIDGDALLLIGPSKSGKSRLAATLIAASDARRSIELVGDDRVLLRAAARGLEARPHPRIAGFLERRGLGLVAMDWCEPVLVAGVVVLGEPAGMPALLRDRYPTLRLLDVDEPERAATVLAWWRSRATACDIDAMRLRRHVG